MSGPLPFGVATLIIPFTVAASPVRRRGGGMSRMVPAAERYRQGVMPMAEGSSIAPIPRRVAKNEDEDPLHRHAPPVEPQDDRD